MQHASFPTIMDASGSDNLRRQKSVTTGGILLTVVVYDTPDRLQDIFFVYGVTELHFISTQPVVTYCLR